MYPECAGVPDHPAGTKLKYFAYINFMNLYIPGEGVGVYGLDMSNYPSIHKTVDYIDGHTLIFVHEYRTIAQELDFEQSEVVGT